MTAPPDYPGALWVPAHPSNFRASTRSGFVEVITHITDGHGDPRAVAEMWQKPHHGSSAHFVVGQDGTVIQCVRLADVAWHAHAANGTGVGIEHCARSPGEFTPTDPGLPVSPAQYAASARLQAWLCQRGGIKPTRDVLVGHAEADPDTTHEDCPTGAWSWETFMPLVVAEFQRLASAALVS